MRLRNGKQYHTPLKIALITCKEKTLNEMREIHIPKLNKLFYVINTNRLASYKKALLVCEIYEYIYNIFGEFVALQHINTFSKLLKTILKKIPILTQQLIEEIHRNNRENILDYDIIKPYLHCIEKLAKVQQLANELK
jgi:hypothetical protein